ncbi:chromosome partitioning protein [Arthrobacter sp. AQ5-05]|uniref:AAA family ATPase n=1 Tax=Arthrobacter sp. AQ5-05 TaxID=2184581 RepID=UPI000DCC746D|nr:chromosome partitioning protein [Arthrobacter sp. AQ5-05]RAX50974.1 chromosome partitioning protein [Arthrobacter sp. AQ5-05]
MNISVVLHGDDGTVVDRLESHRGVLTVARSCTEMAEVIALCETGLADAAILAGPPEEVETRDIDAMIERGVPVLVLCDDAAQGKRLGAAGAYVAGTGSTAPELGILAARARAELGHRDRGADPAAAGEEPGTTARKRARVVVFWGPVGSPGRSLLALNYAVECALGNQEVVLLDADTYGASQAVQLGLLDEAAGIAQICRTVDSGRFDAAKLERICAPVLIAGARMRVATGLPRASRWPELRPTALRRAVLALQEVCDTIVIDVAAPLELDEELSFDTAAPQRNGVTAAMLRIADEVYAVGAANSIGVPRLIRGLEEMHEVLGEMPVKVLFNRVSAANAGASPRHALAETWERFGPGLPIAGYLPNDPAAVDAALLAGSALAEIAPHSGLRVAVAALAGRRIGAKQTIRHRFSPSM